MLNVCFYFQVHQPYRLRNYSIFDINNTSDYFDEEKNSYILCKVARKSYLPTNKVLLDLLKHYPEFKIAFSFSGVVLDQFSQYCPEVINSFQELVATGQVEILAETYYHSLAFLYSQDEFRKQIALHQDKINEIFGKKPTILRNTELIYNNDIAQIAKELGYNGVLVEGAEKILGWRSPNYVYKAVGSNIPLLLKNYKLSDDIAFRFSDKEWQEHPLKACTFAQWVNQAHGNGTNINLFMDYETFGEHQWECTGIFEFLKHLPEQLLKHPDTTFNFPSEIIKRYEPVDELDVPYFVSWADVERDLSAWLGNDMQYAAIEHLYALENDVLATDDEALVETWRKLQTSDHYYYMCTKRFNDGDVHKYFNPYDSPYEAFIYFMNVCTDLKCRLDQLKKNKPPHQGGRGRLKRLFKKA